jgi:hypothetical protein
LPDLDDVGEADEGGGLVGIVQEAVIGLWPVGQFRQYLGMDAGDQRQAVLQTVEAVGGVALVGGREVGIGEEFGQGDAGGGQRFARHHRAQMVDHLPGLGIESLHQPEQGLKRQEAAAVGIAFVPDRIQPGLDFGIQAGVVRAQQRQQVEQAVAAFQEQFSFADAFSQAFQRLAIMVDGGVVAAGQEFDRCLQDRFGEAFITVQGGDSGFDLGQMTGQQVGVQKLFLERFEFGIVPVGAIMGQDVREIGIRGAGLEKAEQFDGENAMLDRNGAPHQPIRSDGGAAKMLHEEMRTARRVEVLVVLVDQADIFRFVIAIDRKTKMAQGVGIGLHGIGIVIISAHSGRHRLDGIDQCRAFGAVRGIRGDGVQQGFDAGQIVVEQSFDAQRLQHRVKGRDTPGLAVGRPSAGCLHGHGELGFVGRRPDQGLEAQNRFFGGRKAGVTGQEQGRIKGAGHGNSRSAGDGRASNVVEFRQFSPFG